MVRTRMQQARKKKTHIAFFCIGVASFLVGTFLLLQPFPFMETIAHSISEKAFDKEELSMVFVGDMMFDRFIRKKAAVYGYDGILAGAHTLTQDADLTVGNLEGPITTYPSRSLNSAIGSPDNFIFTFDPLVAGALSSAGFDAVSLANNHSTNWGIEGVNQTKQYLSEYHIETFGDPYDPTHATVVFERKGYTIALVGYNEFSADAIQTTLVSIATLLARNIDIIVVMAHWGEEYRATPTAQQRNVAHQLVTAGADFVIGAHPHVVQEYEDYEGKRIYYSLGNFVFDQYWKQEVSCAVAVRAILRKGAWIFEEIPIHLAPDGRTYEGSSLRCERGNDKLME